MKKDLMCWLSMPLFYILFCLFLLSVGLYAWFFHVQGSFFDIERIFQASFQAIYWGLAIFSPLLVTGIIMEERKFNMIKVLLAKPINIRKIVLGKIGAVILVILVFLLLSLLHYFSVLSFLAINIDYIVSVYLFLFLVGIAYATISMTVASFFSNYWKSYFFSYLFIFFLHFFANVLGYLSIAEIQIIFNYIGLNSHFDYFLTGGFTLSSFVYLLSIIIIGIATTIYKLSRDNS